MAPYRDVPRLTAVVPVAKSGSDPAKTSVPPLTRCKPPRIRHAIDIGSGSMRHKPTLPYVYLCGTAPGRRPARPAQAPLPPLSGADSRPITYQPARPAHELGRGTAAIRAPALPRPPDWAPAGHARARSGPAENSQLASRFRRWWQVIRGSVLGCRRPLCVHAQPQGLGHGRGRSVHGRTGGSGFADRSPGFVPLTWHSRRLLAFADSFVSSPGSDAGRERQFLSRASRLSTHSKTIAIARSRSSAG
jgi:hypothetical protein